MKSIYKITNKVDNKIYIGKTTKSIQKRFREHIVEANRYKNCIDQGQQFEYESRLYPAMIKYGYDNFKIEEVELLNESDDINEKEIFYIRFYNSLNPDVGYNISAGGLGGPLFAGHHHTQEMKIKQSLVQSGKKWYNNGTDEIMILKGRDVPNGFVPGRIYQGKVGAENPRFGKPGTLLGKPMSTQTKQKLSETKKRIYKDRKTIWINDGIQEYQIDLNSQSIPDNCTLGRLYRLRKNMKPVIMMDLNENILAEFNSISDAGKISGILIGSIQACCVGRTKTAGGYKWKFKNN